MKVIPIKFFKDNFCYAFFTGTSKTLSLVDPACSKTVFTYISQDEYMKNLDFKYVFSTHKHYDHAGDNLKILERYPNISIIGGAHDDIPGCNRPVNDLDSFELENSIKVTVLHTPCHTRGHILFYCTFGESKVLFSGDTLFVGGCGRFFEGDASDMIKAMDKVKALPEETLVYCGHEYTLANLEWASRIDIDNQQLKDKLERVRKSQGPTVPSTIGEEKATNVFMNAKKMGPILRVNSELEAMVKLREMKNKGETLI